MRRALAPIGGVITYGVPSGVAHVAGRSAAALAGRCPVSDEPMNDPRTREGAFVHRPDCGLLHDSPCECKVKGAYPAREQALKLLDQLCEDSLEVPLSHVESMTGRELAQSNISAKFKWLRDLIVENINA